jgi:SAM-dependent methyltransferase
MAFERDKKLAKELREMNPNTKIIDIGCSIGKLPGAIGIDLRAHPNIDKNLTTNIIANVNDPFPIKSNSFDLIIANNIIEHVENVVPTMEEIHRTGKKNSLVVLRTPHYSHPESYRDPTHRWQFTWESFDYFIKDDPKSVLYTDKKFKYEKKELLFGSGFNGKVGRLLSKLSMRRYEKYYCKSYPSNGIYCVLKIIK